MFSAFILSTGRCGTMTLARVLNQHPAVAAFHEPFPRLIEMSGEAYKRPESDLMKLIINIARSDYIKEFNRQGKLYIETANRLTFFAHAINHVFPHAKFIHLVRNPLAVIKSGVRRGWYCGHPWDIGRIVPEVPNNNGRSWLDLSATEKVAWNWVETNSFILKFLDTIPKERKFFVQLERVHEELPRIWSFLGLNEFQCTIDRFNEGSKSEVNENFVPFLLEIGEDIMSRCGYEIHKNLGCTGNLMKKQYDGLLKTSDLTQKLA